MLRPDTTVYMKDLAQLNKHGIGVQFYQPEGKEEDTTKAVLISSESLVIVRADPTGIIQSLVPNRVNDREVPDILEAFEYSYGTLLVPA